MVTENRINLSDSYMNVIRFGSGRKNLVIIAGVSLCGLEGAGEAVADAYKLFQEEYTVYLLDRKKVLPKGYRVEDMADDIWQILQKLEIREADVYGVSQGGMIGLSLAIQHPQLVHSLVICSSQARATEKMKESAEEWIALAEKKDVVGLNRSFFEKVYSANFLEMIEDQLPKLEKAGTGEDCERFTILAQACIEFDVYDQLDQIICPVMILGDVYDQVIGVEGSMDLAETLDCPYYIYDNYSHAVYDEAPDIQEKILEFLQKQ